MGNKTIPVPMRIPAAPDPEDNNGTTGKSPCPSGRYYGLPANEPVN